VIKIAFLAYIIDRLFGEFKFIKHPIILIGELISFYEKKFYKDNIISGLFLVFFVIINVSIISFSIEHLLLYLPTFFYIVILSFLSSMFLAHKMLYDSVKNVLYAKDQKKAISMLVSRDTSDLNNSDINKAAIETYAENLSDGVIAPLFYLILFGFSGIVIYKSINTLDSMVGYRNKKYENFGKVSAKLDDLLNYIPSRITAILIMLVSFKWNIFSFYKNGKQHESPNAGHPITAMALTLNIKLGGNTKYFGVIKTKPFFGINRETITKNDVLKALEKRDKIDFFILTILIFYYII
jgi:adenosylcobinamide-phosphate synthase